MKTKDETTPKRATAATATSKAVAKAPAKKTASKTAAGKTAVKAATKTAVKTVAKTASKTGAAASKGKAAAKPKAAPRKSAAAAKGKPKSAAAKGKSPRKTITKAPAGDKPIKVPSSTPRPLASTEKLAPIVAKLRHSVISALEDMKAKDIKEIDIRGRASFADLLVIASGTSTRHVKSMADEVIKFVKKAGMMPLGIEGQREAEWVLVDLGDIVCHLMLPRIRDIYALERLWSIEGDGDQSEV